MSDKSSNDIVVGILFLCSIITLIVGFSLEDTFLEALHRFKQDQIGYYCQFG